MTTHARSEQLLAAAIDFSLTPAEHTEVADHLASCPTCRALAAAYQTDASGLREIAFVEPPARVSSVVLRAAARRPARSIAPWQLLLAAALLLTALLGAAAGIGAWNSRPALVVVVPIASPSAEPGQSPAVSSPSAVPSAVPSAPVAALPTPQCPAPPQQVAPPVVSASSGNGQVVAATPGSYTTMTCSTTGTADAVPEPPTESLAAYPGDTIRFTVPIGWRFVRWEGSHKPLHGTGTGGVWPPTDLPDAPRSIDLPDGPLLQDEIVSLTVVLVSDDGRAVIELGLQLEVNRNVS
ncbi:MAG TPA: zf-HC2 domain-containing protein [Candidatus Limnocylindrales bacterium]